MPGDLRARRGHSQITTSLVFISICFDETNCQLIFHNAVYSQLVYVFIACAPVSTQVGSFD